MSKKVLLILAVVLSAFVISSCNNSTSDKKTDEKTETDKNEIKYLEDFSRFENSEQVVEYFGEENVINDVWYVAEGTEKYLVTVVNSDCRNKIVVYWDQESDDYKDYAYVEAQYSKYNSEWEEAEEEGFSFPSKSGVKVGMSLQELEKLNGKPITFFGFGWDYGGTVIETSEKLEGLSITVGCPEEDNSEKWSDAYMNLLGDKEFSSDDEAAKAIPIVVTSISYHGK